MSNLLSVFQQSLSNEMVSKISSIIGSNTSATQAGLTSMLPNILKGIVNQGSTETGATSIINLIKNNALGGSTINNMSSLLSGGDKTDNFLDKGRKINSALFGNEVSNMAETSGISSKSSSKLFNIATPLIMGSIGNVIEKDNLDAKGLQNCLLYTSPSPRDRQKSRMPSSA